MALAVAHEVLLNGQALLPEGRVHAVEVLGAAAAGDAALLRYLLGHVEEQNRVRLADAFFAPRDLHNRDRDGGESLRSVM